MSQQEQWQLAGNAPEVYQQHLVPAISALWAPALVEAAALRSGERVLDVACGTGVVARLAAEYVGVIGKVVGLDLNPGMLAVARTVAPTVGVRVEWREGSAQALPFEDEMFDVALCQQGLQFFPDRPAALREMRRVLVPGGRLALTVWRPIEHSPGFAALAEALERHVSAKAAQVMRAPFALGDGEELRALIAGVGFQDVAVRSATEMARFASPEEWLRYQVAGSPLAEHVAQASDEARAALLAEVSAAVQQYVSASGLAFPIEAHLATAHT